jgi:hypothetical protein
MHHPRHKQRVAGMPKRKHECPQMMDLLVDYLEDELDDDAKKALEFHLGLCPPCMNFLETYRDTGHVCRQALEIQMPTELKSNLRAFLSQKCCPDSHEDE